jgi:hypothetical protein
MKEDEMGKTCSTGRETRNVCRILVGKPEGKRPLERLTCRWVDNIKIDLGEIEWCGMGWFGLPQDRGQCRPVVSTVMNLQVPQNVGQFLTGYTTDSL